MARQGKLVLLAPQDAVEFAAVIVEPPVSEPPIKKANRPKIIVGSVTIRLEARLPPGSSLSRVHAQVRHDLSIAALKAMLIASQAREVRKGERIERREKLVVVSNRQPSAVNPRRLTPSNSISHSKT